MPERKPKWLELWEQLLREAEKLKEKGTEKK